MPDLLTTMSTSRRFSLTKTDEGTVIMTDGLRRPKVWDGVGSVRVSGLKPGTSALSVASSGSGSITGDYYAYYRFVDADGRVSDFSPVSTVHSASSASQIDYTSIPAADPDSRAVSVQIWRNTDGQKAVFYLDKTINIGTTSTNSTNTDTQLTESTAIRLINQDGTLGANRHGVPPAWKSVAIANKDRVFYAVDEPYSEGHVEVTNSSDTVQGRNTEFTSDMVGWKFVVIGGAAVEYTISGVSSQQLTLSTTYAGTTDPFATYAVYKDSDEFQKVYYSEDGLPESVPVSQNVIQPQEDSKESGRITALLPVGAYLYIAKENHLYRLSFITNPLVDGAIYPVTSRGCINQRCWIGVEDVAYVLDFKGIYAFNGDASQSISLPIQDIFRNDEINWKARRNFYATHDAQEEVIRFFVCMAGSVYPRDAICYNYRLNRWWTEHWPFDVPSGVPAHIDGDIRELHGIAYNRLAALDQVQELVSTPYGRSTATGSTLCSLTDSSASFTGLPVGTPINIVAGTGKGEQSTVSVVDSATKVSLLKPWAIQPDTTSVYQIGGIGWLVRFGRFLLPQVAQAIEQRVGIYYRPTTYEADFDVRRYIGFEERSPILNKFKYKSSRTSQSSHDSSDTVIDMKKTQTHGTNVGWGEASISRTVDARAGGAQRLLAVELRGVQGRDEQEIYKVRVDGVMP